LTSFKTTKVANDLLREAHAKAMFDSVSDTTTGARPMDVPAIEECDLMSWLKPSTAGDIWWDDFEATTRRFVSDLPWWERFLIWLFPRMYDIREYNP